MDNVLDACKDSIKGWYMSVDRLRVGGALFPLQHPGSIVNWLKRAYPDDALPLERVRGLTVRFKSQIQKLVDGGLPYLEAAAQSDPATQKWLDDLYALNPSPGSVVAIVRTIEGVSSFSCRPRLHKQAKGNPKTGFRPVEIAHHHLTRARHNIAVYYFHLYDAIWGRSCIRIASHLPFEVNLMLNGHWLLQRQMIQRGLKIDMADNAVADTDDWIELRKITEQNLEPTIRSFASHWLQRLPHALTWNQICDLSNYYWYVQTVEVSLNYVFRSPEECKPVFNTLLLHNQLLGTPDSIRFLFGLKRNPRTLTSTKITSGDPMGCFKAFYKSNWLKCYDKFGFVLRFEAVINQARDFVAKKSLSNLASLVQRGQHVCRRLEQSCLTAVSCSVSAQGYKYLVERRVDASSGRVYPGIRPDRPAQQALLATLLSLSHCADGFNNKEFRATHQQQRGVLLNTSQATYEIRKFVAHGLIEPLGKRRRYQLTQAGRSMAVFLVKLYSHVLAPVINAAASGVRVFQDSVAPDSISDALFELIAALGMTPTPMFQSRTS